MDVVLVERELKEFITLRKQKPSRYLGLAFLSNSMPGLEFLKRKLAQYFPSAEMWDKPGHNGAPRIPVSRIDFCHEIFRKQHPDGLIVYLPEEWMVGWADEEKRVFWSNLAETSGLNKIYIIYASTPSNMVHLQSNFHCKIIGESNFMILTSQKE